MQSLAPDDAFGADEEAAAPAPAPAAGTDAVRPEDGRGTEQGPKLAADTGLGVGAKEERDRVRRLRRGNRCVFTSSDKACLRTEAI